MISYVPFAVHHIKKEPSNKLILKPINVNWESMKNNFDTYKIQYNIIDYLNLLFK